MHVPHGRPRIHAAALAACALIALGGCGRGHEKAGPQAAPPREVRVVAVEETIVPSLVVVTGTLAADEEAVLGMKVAGRLLDVPVDLGSDVVRGQTLARLVPSDFELRVSQSEAALEQARSRLGLSPGEEARDLDPEEASVVRQARAVLIDAQAQRDRGRALEREGLLPRASLDALEATWQVAESRYHEARDEVLVRKATLAQRASELELAREQLASATLVAPFDGSVSARHAAPGQFVAAGAPIVTLVRIRPLRLKLAVPEREAAGIRQGQDVRVRLTGDAQTHAGRVARLSPAIDPVSRTLMVEAEVPNEEQVLRAGSFASAEIVTDADRRALVVPRSAIVTFAGLEKVIAVVDGRSVEKRVRTGRRSGDQVEIVEGLRAGDLVVVDPGNLVGGQPVTVSS